MYIRMSIPPSLMLSVGMCGKKSLPTKKHIKMKSSMILSILYPYGTSSPRKWRSNCYLTNCSLIIWKLTFILGCSVSMPES